MTVAEGASWPPDSALGILRRNQRAMGLGGKGHFPSPLLLVQPGGRVLGRVQTLSYNLQIIPDMEDELWPRNGAPYPSCKLQRERAHRLIFPWKGDSTLGVSAAASRKGPGHRPGPGLLGDGEISKPP